MHGIHGSVQDFIPQNIKYRDIYNKKFHQCRGAKKILYGMDMLNEFDKDLNRWKKYPQHTPKSIVIVEGEMDKLSLDEAGIDHGLSVPEGAPAQVSESGNTSWVYCGRGREKKAVDEK